MKQIRISVIIPTYNRERTIERSITSVLNQTYSPFEILVVDDASSDDTCDVVRRIEKREKNVRLIALEKRSGAQCARNKGIQEAKGEWIAFNDSDDEWLPEKTSVEIKALFDNPSCDAVFCDGYIVNGNIRRYKRCGYEQKKIYDMKDVFGSSVMFQGLMVKKTALESIGFLDERVPAYQETDTSFRLCVNNRFVFVQSPLFLWHRDITKSISADVKKSVEGWRYVVLKNLRILSLDDNLDVVDMYYKGMLIRMDNSITKMIYDLMYMLYNANREKKVVKKAIIKIMMIEYRIRYE